MRLPSPPPPDNPRPPSSSACMRPPPRPSRAPAATAASSAAVDTPSRVRSALVLSTPGDMGLLPSRSACSSSVNGRKGAPTGRDASSLGGGFLQNALHVAARSAAESGADGATFVLAFFSLVDADAASAYSDSVNCSSTALETALHAEATVWHSLPHGPKSDCCTSSSRASSVSTKSIRIIHSPSVVDGLHVRSTVCWISSSEGAAFFSVADLCTEACRAFTNSLHVAHLMYFTSDATPSVAPDAAASETRASMMERVEASGGTHTHGPAPARTGKDAFPGARKGNRTLSARALPRSKRRKAQQACKR